MKKILVLGAGVFQVPLIKKVKDSGYKVIVASIKGDYPGIAIADDFVEADTTDIEAIYSAATSNNVSALVTTGTDVSVPTIAAVNERLRLRGPSVIAARNVSSKTEFRKFLKEKGLNCPDFRKCKNFPEALEFYNNQKGKVVLKPDDASGSRGVHILSPGLPDSEFENYYREAMGYSRNGVVCAESFIEGNEVGGDAFLLNGEFLFFTTTHKHMKGVVVRGHTVPGSISAEELEMVKDQLLKVVHQLGYLNGPINFDVIIGKSAVTILEMGLRNGGNGIVNIIHHSQNIDLAQLLIDYVMEEKVSLPERLTDKQISSYVFGASRGGILKNITPFDELKKKVPEIIDMVLAKKPGDFVNSFTHNANLIGYIIFDCGVGQYSEITGKIEDCLVLNVEGYDN